MPLNDPSQCRDHSTAFIDYFYAQRAEVIRGLVTKELVAEHRADPNAERAHRSDALQTVLNYIHYFPALGKTFVFADVPYGRYLVGRITERGTETIVYPEPVFETDEQAQHHIFLERLRDIGVDQTVLEEEKL